MAGTALRSPHLASLPSGHAHEVSSGINFEHIAGDVNLTVHQHRATTTPRPVHSAYLRQVERIAPLQLLDRSAELAELADFCLNTQRCPYLLWQARLGAGKSALLSTFVLTPPAPLTAGRVRLVSFFITARPQNSRDAFITALTEQLCGLLGVGLPASGDEGTREVALLELLAQAAAACQRAGGRMVLIVDGLDEDRSVTTGLVAQSIAGLLPGRPPAGMRVIVAGRPNPPIPDDVPDWHPLRDPGVIRRLSPSPHARDLQRLGQSEVKRLLAGTAVERDLVGLLAASQGGLSGPDLCELTGADLVAVEEILHTVAGRTFTSQLAIWSPDNGSQVYMLGHEVLKNAACRYLGQDRLARYRDRLHAWAEGYRTPTDGQPPWPPSTPEYLLTGYPDMLRTVGDSSRLAALAVDPARHDRMLDLSGGDTTALTEIRGCQDLLLHCSKPDLYTLARLSHHRGQLEARNANIPSGLIALWVTLGRPNRAEQTARAITDPYRRAQALAEVAEAAATAGDRERAHRLTADAEQTARAITDPYWRAQALTRMARAAATAGDHEWAEEIAGAITDPYRQAETLAEVAEAAATAGDRERAHRLTADAEQTARAITDPYRQAQALTRMARAAATARDHERAEEIAGAITEPHLRARALAEVAEAAATAGDHERAHRLIAAAEQTARTITDLYLQWHTLVGVAGAAATAGDHERGEQIARTITNLHLRAEALSKVAVVAATAGDHDRGEQIARTTTDPCVHWHTLVGVAEAAATAGDHERAHRLIAAAEQIALAFTEPCSRERAEALVGVAEVAATAGDHERAHRLIAAAEQIALAIAEPCSRERAEALVGVAEVAATAGDHERAHRLIAAAEQIALAITIPHWRAEALVGVAEVAATADDYEWAEQMARTITEPRLRVEALSKVAEVAATAGDHKRARRLTVDAEQTAQTITDRE